MGREATPHLSPKGISQRMGGPLNKKHDHKRSPLDCAISTPTHQGPNPQVGLSTGLFDFNYSLKTQDLANTSQNSLSRRYNLIRILKVLAITY
ncbi:hypothetical protein L1887_35175 [Cichorium endivia]|nr:hypothetical protein L1887_35175 [Cichorium endivia]